MIKDFETYINEDYFSKLASRKDNGDVRKEYELTEDDVREHCKERHQKRIRSIKFRKDNGEIVVDIDGDFILREDVEEIPFQFGKIIGDFSCANCDNLTSLEGCPKEVSGMFSCFGCKKLTSLNGGPKKVGSSFGCEFCDNLTSLEGCPEEVGEEFRCYKCGKQFTKKEVKSLCDVKGHIYEI